MKMKTTPQLHTLHIARAIPLGMAAAAKRLAAIILAAALLGTTTAQAKDGSKFEGMSKASSMGGVVVSLSSQASAVGIHILNSGGNAADAAVATLFAIGVVRPDMGGLGGDGSAVIRMADGRTAALDFRATGGAKISRTTLTYDVPGMHLPSASGLGGFAGHRVTGVPGTVAGAAALLEKFGSGKFTLAQLIAPAEKLAREGFVVTEELRLFAFLFKERISYYQETVNVYGHLDSFSTVGQKVQLEEYARSLRLIMHNGPAAFYEPGLFRDPMDPPGMMRPSIADLIVQDADDAEEADDTNPLLIAAWQGQANDLGTIVSEDLSKYRAEWRTPITGTYRGHDIITMPPPSCGGVVLVEMLNMLEQFPLGSNTLNPADPNNTTTSWAQSSTNHLHLLAEAQKLAFADRRAYIADPDHPDHYPSVSTDSQMLTSKQYAIERALKIDMAKAARYPDNVPPGLHTNHFCVIDAAGNAIALTNSQGWPFGSGVVPRGTGFLLNNEPADWIDRPSAENRDTFLDQPLAGARPITNMTPTIVVRDGVPVLVVGGAGGAKIEMGVLQAIVNAIHFRREAPGEDYSRHLARALDAERIEAVATNNSGTPEADLAVEETRMEPAVLEALGARKPEDAAGADRRGHTLYNRGEYDGEGPPWIEIAGIDPATGMRHAAGEPRHELGGAAAQLFVAVSRKQHGTPAATHDIDLPIAGSPGIECRTGGDNGNHQIVITFANAVTVNGNQNPQATLSAPNGGSVDTVAVNNAVVTVDLKEVDNEQTITLTLHNVNDGTNTADVVIPMGVLLGDTTGNRSVNSSDIGQTKSRSGQAITAANFRSDVTVKGSINSSDISLVKSKSGTGLP